MYIRRRFIVGGGVLLVVALLVGVALAWWVWRNIDAELLLRNQQAKVIVPDPMDVGINILDDLDILIDTNIATSVPVDQTLVLPIKETLDVMVAFDDAVPIKMTVPIQDTIHLDQSVPVDGEVKARVMGVWINVPVKGELPIKADVPLDLKVPVDQLVGLKFKAPAKVDFLEDLRVPLKTNIDTVIPLKSAMSVPVRSTLNAKARILKPADALIAQMDLKLPLREVGLGFADDEERELPPEYERFESVSGQASADDSAQEQAAEAAVSAPDEHGHEPSAEQPTEAEPAEEAGDEVTP